MEKPEQSPSNVLAFHNSNGFMVARIQDILYCKGDGSYTYIYVKGQPEFLMSRHLKTFEELLPQAFFLRVHQKYLVNKLHIRRYLTNGKNTLLMSNGDELKVSDQHKKRVMSCFDRI